MLWTDFQEPMYTFHYNNNTNAMAPTNNDMYHSMQSTKLDHHHPLQQQPYTTIRKNSLNSNSSSSSSSSTSTEEEEQVSTSTRRKQQRKSQSSKNIDDDEKRKNFLERNRQAALKCRQRKKQWLNNLQARVEYLSNDNEQLQIQATVMRDEVMHLRSILMAHKDCQLNKNVSLQQQDNLLQTSMPGYMNHHH